MKIKLDENVHGDVAGALSARGYDVTTARQEGLGGRPDTEVAAAVKSEGHGQLWILEEDRARNWTP